MSDCVRVLIVEPDQVETSLAASLIRDASIEITGTAGSAREALVMLKKETPDLITIDLELPHRQGLSLTNSIMESNPVPIVVVNRLEEESIVDDAFELLEAGALAAVAKPVASHRDFKRLSSQLISTIKTMSEVKLVRRSSRFGFRSEQSKRKNEMSEAGLRKPKRLSSRITGELSDRSARGSGSSEIVVIGASTGGPTAIKQILANLNDSCPLPIVIAQHIASGFLTGLQSWLRDTSGYEVEIASDRMMLRPSVAYLCPEGFQTAVTTSGRLSVRERERVNGVRPSVSYLFESAAHAYGANAVGILLSGMGQDGADGLKMIHDCGGITIAQDENTSVVHGMPGEAIRIGAVDYVLANDQISSLINKIVDSQRAAR